MKLINKIFQFLENRDIKNATNLIKKNEGKVDMKMYTKWREQDIIRSVLSHSYTDEKEIEFTNGSKSKFIVV